MSTDSGSRRPTLLTIEDLVEYTGVPEGTLERWRSKKIGPPFYRLGKRIFYPEDQLIAWMNSTLSHGSAA